MIERLWRSKANFQTKQQTQNKKIEEENRLKEKQKEKLLLPNAIGCRIIQLQMELSQTEALNKEVIVQLLQEYSKAIQFYEERGSEKYLLYQKKMQAFIQKPAINEILKGKTGVMLIKKQKNQQQVRKAATQSKIVVKKLLQDSNSSSHKQQQIIKKQLMEQQKNLQQRIQRKRANSNRSNRGKVTSASFSVPVAKQKEVQQQLLISQFIDLEITPNKLKDKKSSSGNKVFI